MSNFLNKMKTGMNQVKDKANQTVETTRLSTQITLKRKDRTHQFAKLGELVYQAYVTGGANAPLEKVAAYTQTVQKLDREIEALEWQLARLKGERICVCGKVVARESRYCNHCGQPLSILKDPPQG
ncbi:MULTISPECIES: hypothetical protein [Paenibacillus]|uniref:hypothetical protein n=1 Tax=Paenibacillus TaxID=44249 RepID=UPI00036A8885|nr:hypothetical protein [Paenibacillus massiliensis]